MKMMITIGLLYETDDENDENGEWICFLPLLWLAHMPPWAPLSQVGWLYEPSSHMCRHHTHAIRGLLAGAHTSWDTSIAAAEQAVLVHATV